MQSQALWTLPNLLSASRLALIPLLAALAWTGRAPLFLVALAAGFASDVLDGQIARRWGLASELGAKLDSWGDLALYATLPLFAWWLWPDVLRAETPWLVVAIAAFALPTLIGLLRWGRLTSYHTYLAKLCSWLVGGSAFVLFCGGPSWPFHVATVVLVVEAVEEIAITCVLPRWRSDVPSIWHALAK